LDGSENLSGFSHFFIADLTPFSFRLSGLHTYHMFKVIDVHPEHLKFWVEVADAPPGTQFDWDKGMEITKRKYEAAIDNPACCVWKELSQAYPEAIVILTLHPKGAEEWYESCYETIYSPNVPTLNNIFCFRIVLPLIFPFFRRLNKMNTFFWDRNLKGTMSDKKKSAAEYEAHIEEVRKLVPPEKLLVFKVTEGWG
jgi:hypothetical protein